MNQIIEFALRHWMLAAAFVAILIWLIVEELRSKNPSSTQLSPEAAIQKINREDAHVVDLRGNDAYKKGHIAGAFNYPVGELERHIKKLQKYKDSPIILVDVNSQKAMVTLARLRKAGFSMAYVLHGGISGWQNAKLPLVTPKKKT